MFGRDLGPLTLLMTFPFPQCLHHYACPEKVLHIILNLPEINRLVLSYLIRFLQVRSSSSNELRQSTWKAVFIIDYLIECPSAFIRENLRSRVRLCNVFVRGLKVRVQLCYGVCQLRREKFRCGIQWLKPEPLRHDHSLFYYLIFLLFQ